MKNMKYLYLVIILFFSNIVYASSNELLKLEKDDIFFGKKDAPVTIIEYASLSCSHCAMFHNNVFHKLKENFIDNGKVLFIFRNFPLNREALIAAVSSKCMKDAESAQKFIDLAFEQQTSWYTSKDVEEKMASIALMSGTGKEYYNECISNKNLEVDILKSIREVSESLKIKATPTFFINGEMYRGAKDFEYMKKAIDKNLDLETEQ